MNRRRMSDRGRAMLIKLEGSRPDAYRDVAGYWTIGVGHMLTKDELMSGKLHIAGDPARWRDGLTDDQVGQLLAQDLGLYEETVNLGVLVMLTEAQFDALVSFTFNVGTGAFLRSTLLKRVNGGRLTEVAEQMRHWIFAGGRRWDGLVRRREREIERWNA